MSALLATVLVLAAPNPVERGMRAYSDNKFNAAVSAFYQALSGGVEPAVEPRARLHLAFALWHLGRHSEADAELRVLLRKFPQHDIDDDYFHPTLVQFYRRVRYEVIPPPETPPPIVVAPASVPVAPASTPSASAPVATPIIEVAAVHPSSATLFLRTLPLGIGHFVNKDYVGGALWLAAQAILIGGNIAAAVLLGQNGTAYGYTLDSRREVALFATQNASAGALAAVAIFSILDAHLWSPARVR